MRFLTKAALAAVGLAASAGVASAQAPITSVVVDYTTTGAFSGGGCSGTSCTIGGMTVTFGGVTNAQVTLTSAGIPPFYSFASFGNFTTSGTEQSQVPFPGVSFSMTVTQNSPSGGGSQVVTGTLFGNGVSQVSSTLGVFWNPTTWNIGWDAGPGYSPGQVQYSINGITQIQPTNTNNGVVSIQGDIRANPAPQPLEENVVPEPSTYALMAAGLAGMFAMSRRRRSV